MKLKEKFPASILDIKEYRGDVFVTINKSDLVAIARFLRDSLQYNMLTDVTAVDYLGAETRFMVVYNLYSIPNKDRFFVKAGVSEQNCVIDTVSGLWSSADFLEREVYDLFGIVFEGHPDLRRILMTDDWVGHPLRKDYPLQGPDREPYKGRLS